MPTLDRQTEFYSNIARQHADARYCYGILLNIENRKVNNPRVREIENFYHLHLWK